MTDVTDLDKDEVAEFEQYRQDLGHAACILLEAKEQVNKFLDGDITVEQMESNVEALPDDSVRHILR